MNVDKDNGFSFLIMDLSPLVDISLNGCGSIFNLAKKPGMAKITSIKYSKNGVNLSLLLLRVGLGGMMLTHGLPKLLHYNKMAPDFFDPFSVSGYVSLILVIFSEVVCSVLLIFGLFSRLAVIPLIIQMLIIIFMVHMPDGFKRQELPLHYLTGYIVILILGAGKFSLDAALSRRKKLTKY